LSNKISNTHSVIEVNGRDFPGLLHKITLCLASLGLQIQTATVSTYGERVVDVFYVKDIFGLQIQSETRQQTIRNRLLAIFDDADEDAVGPIRQMRQSQQRPPRLAAPFNRLAA